MNTFLSEKEAVVVFGTETCNKCKMLYKMLEPLCADLHIPLYKVDLNVEVDLREACDVNSIPTAVLYKEGAEISRINGLMPKNKLVDFLENNK